MLKCYNFFMLSIKMIAIASITMYRIVISPLIGNVCIYELSCSEYALKVFREQSFLKALLLTLKRIISCHPWNNKIHK